MDEDSELLHRYASTRDEGAFAELVRRHLALVYQAALRRVNGDAALAEEVAQSVFVSLARSAATLRQRAVLAGWLYVSTRHAAANALRQDRRRRLREQEAHIMHDTPAPGSDVAWAQLRPELDAVMDELSDADRDAVLLRFFENQAYADIGGVLRVSEDAARMRVERALDKLRLSLERRGISSTAVALGSVLAAQSAVAAPSGLAAAVTSTAMATGAASASLGVVAFMSTNKMMATAAGVLVLAAGGTAVFEQQAAQRAERELATLNQVQAATQAQLDLAQARANAADKSRLLAERRAAELATQLDALGKPGQERVGSPAGGTRAKSPAPAFANKMDVLYASPEYAKLQLQASAAAMRLQYGVLYESLHLSRDQIAQFESLMLERQKALYDTFAAARAEGVSVDDPLLTQLRDPAQSIIDEKLKALLGEPGYQVFRDFNKAPNGSARMVAGNLASSLYYTDAPLTAAQGEQLTQLIAANTAAPIGSGVMRSIPEPDWSTIYATAGTFLNAEQLSALQAANERQRLGRQISELSDRLLQEAAVASQVPKD